MPVSFSRLAAAVAVIVALAAGLFSPPSKAEDPHDIDLRLFGENVIQGWTGCRTGFWQANRDPAKDRFAYVFYAPIPDGEELPAWVKLGDDVREISRIDIGSADSGMFEPFRLYRSADGDVTVMMEILAQLRSGDGIEISDGHLTFLNDGKFPFTVRVKGYQGCPGVQAEPAGSGATDARNRLSLGDPVDIDSLDQVPAAVRRAIAAEAPGCEPEETAGFSSAYAINDEMTLWQLPCVLYARNASSVFAVSWTYAPDHASLLMLPAAPGSDPAEHPDLLNATVDPATATITSVSLGSRGDCGIYEKFELRDAEGETLEFILREVREKQTCDGVETDPGSYPLVYDNR